MSGQVLGRFRFDVRGRTGTTVSIRRCQDWPGGEGDPIAVAFVPPGHRLVQACRKDRERVGGSAKPLWPERGLSHASPPSSRSRPSRTASARARPFGLRRRGLGRLRRRAHRPFQTGTGRRAKTHHPSGTVTGSSGRSWSPRTTIRAGYSWTARSGSSFPGGAPSAAGS